MINMDLESTIVTINNLLKLDFESSFSDFIQSQKQLMAIPDYQREYKWEKSKIKTFVDNVMQRDLTQRSVYASEMLLFQIFYLSSMASND